uniref:Uncharacterized protein n=1 Tax=Oryza brachyantha TaxID=4533 RepID=J3LUJ7_ORYBR
MIHSKHMKTLGSWNEGTSPPSLQNSSVTDPTNLTPTAARLLHIAENKLYFQHITIADLPIQPIYAKLRRNLTETSLKIAANRAVLLRQEDRFAIANTTSVSSPI